MWRLLYMQFSLQQLLKPVPLLQIKSQQAA
jgi:hypothetical protein